VRHLRNWANIAGALDEQCITIASKNGGVMQGDARRFLIAAWNYEGESDATSYAKCEKCCVLLHFVASRCMAAIQRILRPARNLIAARSFGLRESLPYLIDPQARRSEGHPT